MHLQRWQVIEATSGSVIAGTAGWQIPAAGVNEFLEFSITSLFPVQPAMQGLVFLLRLALNRLAVPFSVTHGSCFPAIEDAVSAVQHWMGPGDLSCMHVRCCICLLVTQEPAVPAKPLLQVERLDSSAPGVDLLARLSARLADCLSISQCGLESMDEILDLLQQMTASWSAEEAAALEQFQQAASLDAALSAAELQQLPLAILCSVAKCALALVAPGSARQRNKMWYLTMAQEAARRPTVLAPSNLYYMNLRASTLSLLGRQAEAVPAFHTVLEAAASSKGKQPPGQPPCSYRPCFCQFSHPPAYLNSCCLYHCVQLMPWKLTPTQSWLPA